MEVERWRRLEREKESKREQQVREASERSFRYKDLMRRLLMYL